MHYTFDTEFHDHPAPHGVLIEPISIGIVSENKETLYLEFNDFNWSLALANPFLAQNVLPHLGPEEKRVNRSKGIKEIKKFIGDNDPTFWAFFDHYDWVVLCAIFGGMAKIPRSWGWCNDLRQIVLDRGYSSHDIPEQTSVRHHALSDALWNMRVLKWLMARNKL